MAAWHDDSLACVAYQCGSGSCGGRGGNSTLPQKHVAAAPRPSASSVLGYTAAASSCLPAPALLAFSPKVDSARERGGLKSFPGRRKKKGFLQPHCCAVRKAAPLGRERGCLKQPNYRSTQLASQLREMLSQLLQPYPLLQREGRRVGPLGPWLVAGEEGRWPSQARSSSWQAGSSLGATLGLLSVAGAAWTVTQLEECPGTGRPGHPVWVTQRARLAPISVVGRGQ